MGMGRCAALGHGGCDPGCPVESRPPCAPPGRDALEPAVGCRLVGLTSDGLAVSFSQGVVDGGRRHRSLGGRHRDLVQAPDDIARRIETRDAGLLVRIHDQAVILDGRGTKRL